MTSVFLCATRHTACYFWPRSQTDITKTTIYDILHRELEETVRFLEWTLSEIPCTKVGDFFGHKFSKNLW